MTVKTAKSAKKVGLALGSGFARGLAHIGVLKVLEREGIPVDMIAGTSIGSVIGGLYALGANVARITRLAQELGSSRLSFILDPALPKTGLIRGKRIESRLKSFFGDTEFSDLKIPFACLATDIYDGSEVVIKEGLVREAARASISIPVVLAVVKRGGRYLVDGSLVNPVPVSILKAMGADIIIAVNVLPYREIPGGDEPNIFEVIMQTLHISSYRVIAASLAGADIVIEPRVVDIGYADFHRVDEGIMRGESAAEQAIPEIRRLLSGTTGKTESG